MGFIELPLQVLIKNASSITLAWASVFCHQAEQLSSYGGICTLLQFLRKMGLDLIITWKLWLYHSASPQ